MHAYAQHSMPLSLRTALTRQCGSLWPDEAGSQPDQAFGYTAAVLQPLQPPNTNLILYHDLSKSGPEESMHAQPDLDIYQ